MEAKYKKFKEFNWKDSEEWQSYFRNLYPTPPGSKIEKYKKKFYKLKIDPDFDVNYLPPEEQSSSTGSGYSTSTGSSGTSYNYQNFSSPSANPAIPSPALLSVETLLIFLFGFSLPFNFHTLKLSTLALIIRTVRFTGKPQFNMAYVQKLLSFDCFFMLIYSVILFIERFNYYLVLPIAMSLLIYLTENLTQISQTSAQIRPYLHYLDFVTKNKNELLQCRAHVEVAIGFLQIVGIFFRLNSFLLPMIYWQNMKVKYVVNPYVKNSFRILNDYANSFKNNSSTPGIVKIIIEKVQWVFEYMGKVDPQQGQSQGGCQIF